MTHEEYSCERDEPDDILQTSERQKTAIEHVTGMAANLPAKSSKQKAVTFTCRPSTASRKRYRLQFALPFTLPLVHGALRCSCRGWRGWCVT